MKNESILWLKKNIAFFDKNWNDFHSFHRRHSNLTFAFAHKRTLYWIASFYKQRWGAVGGGTKVGQMNHWMILTIM